MCLFVTSVNYVKTAEPIEMPLEVWTCGGPRNRVLGGAWIPHGKGHFGGSTWVCQDLTAVDMSILSIIHNVISAIRPLTTSTVANCFPSLSPVSVSSQPDPRENVYPTTPWSFILFSFPPRDSPI